MSSACFQVWEVRCGALLVLQVIVPIHLSVHWTLAVINLRDKCFYFLDSMFGDDRGCLQQLVCSFTPRERIVTARMYACEFGGMGSGCRLDTSWTRWQTRAREPWMCPPGNIQLRTRYQRRKTGVCLGMSMSLVLLPSRFDCLIVRLFVVLSLKAVNIRIRYSLIGFLCGLRNRCDCGVFMVTYAEYEARDAPLHFSQVGDRLSAIFACAREWATVELTDRQMGMVPSDRMICQN